MTCVVCGQAFDNPVWNARYCSPACRRIAFGRSRKSPPLYVNTVEAGRTDTDVDGPSVRRAIQAAQLKPTPAQIVAALARVGREMGR